MQCCRVVYNPTATLPSLQLLECACRSCSLYTAWWPLLAEVPLAEVALQLFLQAAYAASEVAHKETLAYEMFEQV